MHQHAQPWIPLLKQAGVVMCLFMHWLLHSLEIIDGNTISPMIKEGRVSQIWLNIGVPNFPPTFDRYCLVV